MKKPIVTLLCFAMFSSSVTLRADDDSFDTYAEQTEDLYRTGSGAQEGAYSSLALSMLGWGLGIAAGIGILASVLHQSTSSSDHDSCNTNNH